MDTPAWVHGIARVVPCCLTKDAKSEMGNLQNHSFEKSWRGE
ncbi:MAG: SPASM domain-containing protein [Bacteroidetes bacterium]|nr:SPASM domain-containing protein [Bacteroidota bacterium]